MELIHDSRLLDFIYLSFDGIIFRWVRIPLCGYIKVSQAPVNHNKIRQTVA